MSTDLAVVEPSRFVALAPDSGLREAMQANLGEQGFSPADLTRVKFPSAGATAWTIPGVRRDETADAIEGLWVGFFPRGVLWPGEESVEGTLPALVTYDLLRATKVGDMPVEMADQLEPYRLPDGAYDWQRLSGENTPFGWGTGKQGYGKRAKEQRVLFILREQDAMPLMISVGPGSLRVVQRFISSLTASERIPYFRSVVSLRLEKARSKGGTTYSRLVMNLIGSVDAETGAAVKRTWTDNLAKMFHKLDVEVPSESEDDE